MLPDDIKANAADLGEVVDSIVLGDDVSDLLAVHMVRQVPDSDYQIQGAESYLAYLKMYRLHGNGD
ncbi:MAG: hypothetical protein AABW46_01045 [Nanoarchaeota archaeon]